MNSYPVPHEQAAIFEENERIANAVQIERVRSTKQSGWYHKNSEEQAAIFEENERITNAVQIVRVRSTEQSGWYHDLTWKT